MENNIEQKIKKHFEQREIKPSYNAWNALATKLDLEAKKEKKNKFHFLWYAAILVGLFFAVGYFIPNSSKPLKNNTKPIIVDRNKDKITPNKTIIKPAKEAKKQEVIVQNETPRIKKIKKQTSKHTKNTQLAQTSSKKESNSIHLFNQASKVKNTETVAIANTQIENNKKMQPTMIENKIKTRLITSKETSKIKNTKKKLSTSDSDIDNLLAMAMNIGKKERNYSIDVNHKKLQHKVEENLNKSNILRVLKTGVDTVEALVSNN